MNIRQNRRSNATNYFCQIMLKNLLYKFKTDSEYFYKNTHFLIRPPACIKNVNTNQNKIQTAN